MRYGRNVLLILAVLLSVSAFGQTFTATLSGANEVPPGDADGFGTATVVFNGTNVIYTVTVANIVLPPIGLHIHQGAAGVNGPIVINLPGTWVGGTLSGTTTTTPAQVAAINANPAGFYVNVHTSDFPGGAIRGQLSAVALPAAPTASATALLVLFGVLAVAGVLAVKRLV